MGTRVGAILAISTLLAAVFTVEASLGWSAEGQTPSPANSISDSRPLKYAQSNGSINQEDRGGTASAQPSHHGTSAAQASHYAVRHARAMHAFHKHLAAKAALTGDTTAHLNRAELARIQSGEPGELTGGVSAPPAAAMPGAAMPPAMPMPGN